MHRTSLSLLQLVAIGFAHTLVPTTAHWTAIGLSQPVLAETQPMRTLVVTGEGVERIPATLAKISLGVEVKGNTAGDAQRAAAQQSSALLDFLRSQKVERLQTIRLRLNPIYRATNNQRSIVGYSATNIVSFQVESQRAGQLLDEAVRSGATRIENIQLTAPDAAIEQAQEKALKAATRDAQRQANAVLSSLNLTPHSILGIQINHANAPRPMPHTLRVSAAPNAEFASTAIAAGDQQVRALVTLTIKY